MILITGGNGQLGTELRKLLDEQGVDYLSTDAKELDITNEEQTMAYITKVKPSVIYHCAAYTAVDKAEDEAKDLDEEINGTGTQNVANAWERHWSILVPTMSLMAVSKKAPTLKMPNPIR